MGRTAGRKHQVIGAVHQCADRALARSLEAALHPVGRCAIGHAPDDAPVKCGAAFGIVDPDLGRARALALYRGHFGRLECAQPRCGQIARDTHHAHAVGPVRRDRHIEHGRCIAVFGKAGARRRILGQFDDAVMLVAQFQFAHGTHHAIRFDAADRALAQFHPVGGDHRARQAEHAFHSRARIGRTADDLQRVTLAGIDTQHLQLVGIRVRPRRQHMRDAEAGQLVGRVLDTFDLVADPVERGRNVGDRSVGLEVILQPFERELHAFAPTPAERVGWSKAEKP